MKISTVLDSIDLGNIALPEFQRGYVWGREQVRELMRSLYRRYPVGSLLLWPTTAESTATRGGAATSHVVELLLDGQQRITSLYGIMRGYPPTFFQGDVKAFADLYFDLRTETFEFYGPVKMKDDPYWVNVTELYKTGISPWVSGAAALDLDGESLGTYIDRLNRVVTIRDIELHPEKITGAGLGVDEVVEIFNRVNSGGTKLSKGDLALARICAAWPEARQTMVDRLDGWREVGFDFTLDWLLRVTNAILTGEALFDALKDVKPAEFREALNRAGTTVDSLLNLVGSRLGIDHDRVLGGRYAFPVMARYWTSMSGKSMTDSDRGKLLYWYVQAAIWGRHSGSTESTLNQDLRALDSTGLDGLIDVLRVWRGDLQIRPENFGGAYRGSRFYPLIYLLTRVHGARDFATGNELSSHLLGKFSSLQLHHIFPKALLVELGYDRANRNALANFCFLTQETNLAVGRKDPVEYLPQYEVRNPGVLASQWIPQEADLWSREHYTNFLGARRDLLAQAANSFLDSLLGGASGEYHAPETLTGVIRSVDAESEQLSMLAGEAVGYGFAAPEIDHEIVDAVTGEIQAIADLAWPDGLRTGLTQPIAYLSEPDEEMERRLGELGYRFFATEQGLRWYFEDVLGVDLDGDGSIGASDALIGSDVPTGEAPSPEPAERRALSAEFHQAMVDLYETTRRETPYHPNYFIQMIADRGGLDTAHHLLGGASPSSGFAELFGLGRLDLTVEALVLRPEFAELFSARELRTARRRLEDLGFDVLPT